MLDALFLAIILIVLLIFVIYIILSIKIFETMESQPKGIKWIKSKDCKYKTTDVYLDVFKEYGINETSGNDWEIYIPCSYNGNINEEINKINFTNDNQKIFAIDQHDEIAGKNTLWSNLIKKYGRLNAKKLMPDTYILNDPEDMKIFEKVYDPNKIYIMKKNIQRQEGLKITKDKSEILTGFTDNYVIVQELLQNPYLINGRKINLRFYVLVICKNNMMEVYVFRDGFVYYTKSPFVKNSMDESSNITTGYIERWIYHINPLTHTDLKKYLDQHGENSQTVFYNIHGLIADVFRSFDHLICSDHLKQYCRFQLFGVDIALDDKLNPSMMEINKGPSLDIHDQRDGELKKNVIRGMLKVLNVIPNKNSGFIRII